jgi:hypothetical protein
MCETYIGRKRFIGTAEHFGRRPAACARKITNHNRSNRRTHTHTHTHTHTKQNHESENEHIDHKAGRITNERAAPHTIEWEHRDPPSADTAAGRCRPPTAARDATTQSRPARAGSARQTKCCVAPLRIASNNNMHTDPSSQLNENPFCDAKTLAVTPRTIAMHDAVGVQMQQPAKHVVHHNGHLHRLRQPRRL